MMRRADRLFQLIRHLHPDSVITALAKGAEPFYSMPRQ